MSAGNNLRKFLILVAVLFFCFGTILPSSGNIDTTDEIKGIKASTTLYVGGTGPGNYSKIQDAIDNASAGDTVFVYKGTYYENVLVNKTINLTGESKENTIIDGGGSGDVVCVESDWVNISGFWVMNGEYGLHTKSSNNNLTNCAVYNTSYGIRLHYSTPPQSSNNKITACHIYNNSHGVLLTYASNSVLRDNILENNTYNFGIEGTETSHFYQDTDTSNTINNKPIYYIVEQSNRVFDETMSIGYLGLVSCNNITVKNLELKYNREGLLLAHTTNSTIATCHNHNNCDGIYFYHSSNNTISDYQAHDNSGYGIVLTYSSNNDISTCDIYDNTWGIDLYSSSNNSISVCEIYRNHMGITLGSSSCNNHISACKIYDSSEDGFYLHDSSTDNIIVNCSIASSNYYDFYFPSSSTATTVNTTFSKTKVCFADAVSVLTVRWHLHVKVINVTNSPVSDANVRIRDNENGTFDLDYPTGSDGYVRWIECTEYVQNKTVTTYYTPHNITASKSGYNDNYSNPLMDASKEVTIMLSKADTTPPSVLSTAPSHAGTTLNASEKVIVVFSESMSTSATPTLTQIAGTVVAYTFAGWSTTNVVNDTATWTHAAWADPDNITLNISGYQDLAENIGEPYEWWFKVNSSAEVDVSVVASDINPHGPVAVGQTYNITAVIRNIGKGDATVNNVYIYVDGSPLAIIESFPQTLLEGKNLTIHSTAYEIPNKDNITIRVVIDISDSNPDNDEVEIEVKAVVIPPAPVSGFYLTLLGLLITIFVIAIIPMLPRRTFKYNP